MRLADAASFFDNQICVDAFNPDITFFGQLDLFDDNKRDGTTTVRRILSVADGVVLPASGAIAFANSVYMLGNSHEDVFQNEVIRRGYSMEQSDGPASIKTFAQAAAGLPGTATFASKVFVKDLREPTETSRLYPAWDIVVPISTPVPRNTLIYSNGAYYLSREPYITAGGFYNVQANQLSESQPETVVYTDRSGQGYDPATDKTTGLAPSSVVAMVIRYEDYFRRLSTEAPKDLPGDRVLAVAKTLVTTPNTGDEWTSAAGIAYRVQAVSDDGISSWLLHSRRT